MSVVGALFVVGLRCHVVEPGNVYRIEATVQIKLGGTTYYEEHVEHFVSWLDAATFLIGLLPLTAAEATVESQLSLLRS